MLKVTFTMKSLNMTITLVAPVILALAFVSARPAPENTETFLDKLINEVNEACHFQLVGRDIAPSLLDEIDLGLVSHTHLNEKNDKEKLKFVLLSSVKNLTNALEQVLMRESASNTTSLVSLVPKAHTIVHDLKGFLHLRQPLPPAHVDIDELDQKVETFLKEHGATSLPVVFVRNYVILKALGINLMHLKEMYSE